MDVPDEGFGDKNKDKDKPGDKPDDKPELDPKDKYFVVCCLCADCND